jgi:energy-coupling factor transporter transmembrane protein EcfT
MELNGFGAIVVFLIASYPGLIISILIFCVSVIVLFIKRKKISNIIKIVLLLLIIILAFLIGFSIWLSFSFGRPHSVAVIGGADGPTAVFITESNNTIQNITNELELSYNDYEIIKYEEHKINTNKNTIQINFELKIMNMEKLNILENKIVPTMYVFINNKKYLAKGQLSILSTFPREADCMFPIDNDGKIIFFENGIINFLGFENRNE